MSRSVDTGAAGGVLSFGDPVVYTQWLEPLGLTIETIGDELRTTLDSAIHRVMEGREDGGST